ncbi:hypothetical protein [Mycolicibacterium sp.]|uniref:hypothetical protein n=1 Tax=Mycolicibacterium sp. TaxID=2320850 RepID=UPI00355D492F
MATVEMIVPTGRVVSTFVPTETFHSEQFASSYVEGMKYYVREGNNALAAAVQAWAEAGRVTII